MPVTDHALLHRGAVEQGAAFLQKPFLPESLLSNNRRARGGATRVETGQLVLGVFWCILVVYEYDSGRSGNNQAERFAPF
jgi:hypothetical protein